MPVLNEERHLESAVESVLGQEHSGRIELILALGPSTDRTNEIAGRLRDADPRVRLVENPSGATASALNRAVSASSHPVIIRLDAHSSLSKDYIATAVKVLADTGADNVGGVMAAVGQTDWESAVAGAMTSPLGVGSAPYHVGGNAGPSASVYLGCFRRKALERVNGFDERFRRAQDWELNHRLLSSGGLVWFTPDLQVAYRPRPNIVALARQYFEYGRWRHALIRAYPETKSLRYLAAPLAVALLCLASLSLVAGLASLAYSNSSMGAYLLVGGVSVWVFYLLGELAAGLYISRRRSLPTAALTPIALVAMHLSWGLGFITSPRRLSLRSSRT